MNIGSYRGAAAMAAYEKWQAVTSQNIAASSMPGFKKNEVSFESVAGDVMRIGQGNSMANEARGGMPSVSTKTSFAQGELHRTGSEMDFAIQGRGFFQVQRENGQMGYTRAGEFHVGPDHKLLTKQGFPVMGDGGPIVLNPEGGSICVNSEGAIVQGSQVVGKLAIFDTSEPQSLRRIGDVMFSTNAAGQRLDRVETPAVVNGYVEGSNVSPLAEMVNLINVSRAYEACQKTTTSDGDTTDHAIQILGNPQP